MSDYSRVLLGARMVLERAVRRMSPELRTKIERNFQHTSDLIGLIFDISRVVGANAPISRVENEPGFQSRPSTAKEGNSRTSSSSNEPASIRKDALTSISNMNMQKSAMKDISHPVIQEYFTPSVAESVVKTTKQADEDLIGFSSVQADEAAYSSLNDAPSSSSETSAKQMRERAVPSTQFGRMVGFGGLAMRMAFGEAVDRASYAFSGSDGPRTISDKNAERLAESLCRMRGAALKLGQMLSIQDEDSIPPSLRKALERVRQGADYMPKRQLEAQLTAQLGENWKDRFKEFDPVPIAAASIGQVHRAVLHNGTVIALKIQYPGVAESIDSDLNNLKTLVRMTNLLPPGLFIDSIIKVASEELREECDYAKEAISQIRYRELILADKVLRKHVNVPEVYTDLCTSRVLATRLIPGVPIDKALSLPQSVRNAIARTTLVLTIRELFEWRFIQSDPNFANFLYDNPSRTVHMIDFGAAREYKKAFVDGYMRLVWAAANQDRDTILQVSKDLGFLTGDESKKFLDAHVEAGLVVGEPFLKKESFDFANSHLTQRIGQYGGTFMQYRLTPPPSEAYSLHRKLAGAFLLCIKLKANIPCRDILETTFNSYQF